MNEIKKRRRALERRLRGARQTTAEILYHLPDYPSILQSYVWQFDDMAPAFPRLNKFLDYWEDSLEARIYSVKVAHAKLIKPAELRNIDHSWVLH